VGCADSGFENSEDSNEAASSESREPVEKKGKREMRKWKEKRCCQRRVSGSGLQRDTREKHNNRRGRIRSRGDKIPHIRWVKGKSIGER